MASLKFGVGLVVALLVAAGGVALVLTKYEREAVSSTAPAVVLPDLNQTRPKAEGGDPDAQNALGEIYAEGKQVRSDYAESAKWYRKAADQGLAKAQHNLAVLYDIGQGLTQNEAEAVGWYLKAAEQGFADAQYTVAGMYGLGRGVKRDPKEALKWYQRAAEQGDPLARYNLAERYERGKDVAEDPVEAYKWHSLAASVGLKDAVAARDSLGKRMSSEQLAEARKRVREFEAKYPAKKAP